VSTTPIFVTGNPPSRFRMVYFLYDPTNHKETEKVEALVKSSFPHVKFLALWLPPFRVYEKQVEIWASNLLPLLMPNSLLVGIGRAGTAACWLQEHFSDMNLSVMAVNASTEEPDFKVERSHRNRVALFAKDYPPIKGYTENWSWMAENSFDVGWLQHGILSESGANLCKYSVLYFITAYLMQPNIRESCSRVIGDGEYELFLP
jgi:hypothetical protein